MSKAWITLYRLFITNNSERVECIRIKSKKTGRALVSALLASVVLLSVFTLPAYAATNPHGAGQGRIDSRNVNDYSTSNWDRMIFNYEFQSGPETRATFGVPTQASSPGSNPLNDNVRRNKDVAFLPPSYGVFSGEIPTDRSSLLHSPDSVASVANNSFPGTATVNYYGNDTGVLQSTSLLNAVTPSTRGADNTNSITVNQSAANQSTANSAITQPAYYDDGSIGFLSIPAIDAFVRVYEGETEANMRLGAGRFAFTSGWDGNIGLAGHNRGPSDYFRGIVNLQNGDLMTYETPHGTRTYRVYLIEQISDDDFSYLGFSRDNIITLITCVMNVPNMRWVVQAREVR